MSEAGPPTTPRLTLRRPATPVEVRVEDLSRAFSGRRVLVGINIEILAGEIVAIVGGSGSGKTVLLDHMAGLLTPDSGRVRVADHDAPLVDDAPPLVDLAALAPEQLDSIRLHWSIVFQRNALFSGTVQENIELWLREHTGMSDGEIKRRVRQSVEAVALDPADVLRKEREELSGGMAKRVAIARAIATNPILIMYDEPTTGLDPVVGGHIHELIWNTHHLTPTEDSKRAGRGSYVSPRTSVIVTHDKELLRRLRPRVVMLHEGRVCYDGPYERFGGPECPPAQMYLQAMPVLHARPVEGGRTGADDR